MTEVVIDGTVYIPKTTSGQLKIVVLDRGFVVVGRVRHEGAYLVIDDCQCVRRWGTTKGLGELASKGPLANTTLDPQPRTTVHELQVVQVIDCEESAWKR